MRYSDAFGEKASKMFLGTAYFGDGISQEDAFAIMDKFRENGGTHIDTARLYAKGKAEEIVGKWLKAMLLTVLILFSLSRSRCSLSKKHNSKAVPDLIRSSFFIWLSVNSWGKDKI